MIASIECATVPAATVVSGTPMLFTMQLSATGKDATLQEMIIWRSATAIIGIQDSCDVSTVAVLGADWGDMPSSQLFRYWPAQHRRRRFWPVISTAGYFSRRVSR
jgi:hypothetical protein